ncbi:hypothetical protein GCM10010129_78920 [Streptomyces fumigatiscleroticus]|nr:hypothetical protein GCM10010129_78920 [Streptomyces fumigatiscleroticus]
MVTQIITLVGVLIGAMTSYLATAMAERAKFRRLMATRWDERKLDTYIEYVSCIKEIQRAAMAAGRARDQGGDASDALRRATPQAGYPPSLNPSGGGPERPAQSGASRPGDIPQ